MSYERVLPRDLFNESKLLKCLGQLTLLVHDGVDSRGQRAPPLSFFHPPGSEFLIDLDADNCELICINLNVYIDDETRLIFSTPYNCKDPYPLLCICEGERYNVFNDDGSFAMDFLLLMERFQ